MSERPSALTVIRTVVDADSWVSWDEPPAPVAPPGSEYAADLAAAAQRSGADEAIITGEARIRGHRVAVVAGEFGFLAGSIGVTAAERIVRAFERAREQGLPMFASPASGGTRMQEGTPAFVGMVKISAAVAAFKAARLPYIVYLRHPTTGGVFASWGSLGHVTVAQPGALIGFLGPRVYEALYGHPFPEGVQTAENLYRNGLVDAVLPIEELADVAAMALNLLTDPRGPHPADHPADHPAGSPAGSPAGAPAGLAVEPAAAPPAGAPLSATGARTGQPPIEDVPAWESIERTRRPERPSVRALLKAAAQEVIVLHGTGQGEYDPTLMLALARFGGNTCVVLGQNRRGQTVDAPLTPSGLRAARRGIHLAHELGLPLVSVIDTPGAALSKEAEEGGMAGEIARTLSELVTLDAPTVCVLLGQGTGGGALALLPADRVVCAQHSWLSPLPPEGAAAILHREPSFAAHIAAAQQVRSVDLLRAGIVDRIVPEYPDAADEPEAFCHRLSGVIERELEVLLELPTQERLGARLARYRRLG